jgi:hypothetical protein
MVVSAAPEVKLLYNARFTETDQMLLTFGKKEFAICDPVGGFD